MAEKDDDMKKQRRHWGMTVHYGHLGLDALQNSEEEFTTAIIDWWQELCESPALRYAVGQIERTKEGLLHGQVYTEWHDKIRGRTLVRRHQSSVKPRWADRDVCRDYHRKSETRVAPLGEWGDWREESIVGEMSPKQRALQYIIRDGLKPVEIAALDPDVYFTHHRAINELHKALTMAEQYENDRRDDEAIGGESNVPA